MKSSFVFRLYFVSTIVFTSSTSVSVLSYEIAPVQNGVRSAFQLAFRLTDPEVVLFVGSACSSTVFFFWYLKEKSSCFENFAFASAVQVSSVFLLSSAVWRNSVMTREKSPLRSKGAPDLLARRRLDVGGQGVLPAHLVLLQVEIVRPVDARVAERAEPPGCSSTCWSDPPSSDPSTAPVPSLFSVAPRDTSVVYWVSTFSLSEKTCRSPTEPVLFSSSVSESAFSLSFKTFRV